MRGSASCKAYHKELRARKISHQAALRQVANRWAGIPRGALKTGQPYQRLASPTTNPSLGVTKWRPPPLHIGKPGMSADVRESVFADIRASGFG